jgi:hypothetical protein
MLSLSDRRIANPVMTAASALFELFYPPQKEVVLFHLHAAVWWGAVLAVVGAFYCFYYTPGKGRG